MEFLTICSIVYSVLRDETGHCNWDSAKDVDTAKIHSMYTCIVALTQSMGMSLSIYTCTVEY